MTEIHHGDIDAIDEATLAGLTRPRTAGLVGAVQRRAVENNQPCRVVVRTGELVPTVDEFAGRRRCVIVSGCPEQCTATGYQRVQALIRESRNPVLVV